MQSCEFLENIPALAGGPTEILYCLVLRLTLSKFPWDCLVLPFKTEAPAWRPERGDPLQPLADKPEPAWGLAGQSSGSPLGPHGSPSPTPGRLTQGRAGGWQRRRLAAGPCESPPAGRAGRPAC